MEPIQAGAAVMQDFGTQGGILGLIIAALFIVVIVLIIMLWKNMQILQGISKTLGMLAGVLQSKPCLSRDTSIRQKLKDAV